jgi:shikimate kinase
MTAHADTIVLVGPMGAGKTSIGRRAARRLELPFVDTDAIVVREHGPIAELFTRRGEAYFRRVERAAVQRALVDGGVIALGGGAVIDDGTRADLRTVPVVQLTVQPHIVASRITGGHRPLLNADPDVSDPLQRWQSILAARQPWYDEVADLTIDTSTGPLSRVVDTIVGWAEALRESASEHGKSTP